MAADGRRSFVVRAGDDLYVRSATPQDNPWFRRALATGTGRIEADGTSATSRSRSRAPMLPRP
jgi:hypothetical protein